MWQILKTSGENWLAHNDARLGAAIAYYSIFSLGPLLVIAMTVAGLFFGRDAVETEVSESLGALLGNEGAEAVEDMLAGASQPSEGGLAALIGAGALLFAAIGVVIELKNALNTIWRVGNAREKGFWRFIRTYILSLAAVVSVGFLLLVSLTLTATLAAIGTRLAGSLPDGILQLAGSAASFLLVTTIFAMIFRFLPDTVVPWRSVWLGAAITGVLFELGKLGIGLYIGKLGLESSYGAAASLVVVLIWVYYSAQILLFGAELTHAHATRASQHQGESA